MTQSIASTQGDLFVVLDWNYGQRGEPKFVVNPHSRKPIVPYVPSEQFTHSAVRKNPHFSSDYSLIILGDLDVRDLANLSEVDKGCYLALKRNSIWDIQFHKFSPKAKLVDQSLCSFNAEDQFKITYKRFNDELKPFVTQYETNNKMLMRLRGTNGLDGEVNRLLKEFEASGGYPATFNLRLAHIPFSQFPLHRLSKAQEDQLEQAKKADKKERLYQAQNKLCEKLAGSHYDGTRSTLSSSSNQGQILHMIEFGMSNLFNTQKKMEEVIRDSANAKGIMPANPIAKAWMRGHPMLLVDLGVISGEDFLQKLKLNCRPYVLEHVGLYSLADLQVLGLLSEPFVKEIELPKEPLSEEFSERHKQIYERKECCTNLLKTLSEKIEKKIEESTPYNTIFFEDGKNPWGAFKNRFEEVGRGILKNCESPANLSKNYEQIIKEINALIAEFNEQDRQYQISKLRTYIHQPVDPRFQWGIIEKIGYQPLSEYAAQNPGVNLFKMGTEG